mmetsp:Transcript_4864/g.9093  ORF Transcript_4864/g.9093 Transcript_4864/m.9093 type:complete len:80 (-) Transcript_4864:640-879(-)
MRSGGAVFKRSSCKLMSCLPDRIRLNCDDLMRSWKRLLMEVYGRRSYFYLTNESSSFSCCLTVDFGFLSSFKKGSIHEE